MVKKVVVTEGRFKGYSDEIQQSSVLGFTPYRLHEMVHLLPLFVFMMGRYMYWTMLSRWRLEIEIL